MTEPQAQRDYCPKCGVAYEPLQEYCLECGARLPTNRGVVGVLAGAWQRRLAWYPGDWIWPALLLLVLTVIATAAVVAANSARRGSAATLVATTPSVTVGPGAVAATVAPVSESLPNAPAPTITTGPLPTAPGGPATGATVPARPPVNPNALTVWPAGQTGYTVILESMPVADGRPAADARARQAKRNGLVDVGVLVTSGYSSLHAGYFAIFSGIYQSQPDASAAVAKAHAAGFPDAYQTRVTR